MKSRTRLAVIVGGIVAGSLVAFCFGLVFTLVVIMPAREPGSLWPPATLEPTVQASRSPGVGPLPLSTPGEPSPTATHAAIVLTPTLAGPSPTPVPSVSATAGAPVQSATPPPSPTPTSDGFAFHYVDGSRVERENCFSQYLQGWIYDAGGAPLNGVTISWERWGESFFEISGDLENAWRTGEWKFTYGYGQSGFDPTLATDFELQILASEDDPRPLSEPLVIHYAGCFETGQITNIVFKQR